MKKVFHVSVILALGFAVPGFAQQRWTRTYGGAREDGGSCVKQTLDGGYIISGHTYSFGPGTPTYANVYLVKTNASGDTLWTRFFGGAEDDFGQSVQQTSDAGYIVAGTYNSWGSNPQVYLIKTNATGDPLWTRTYGGANTDRGYSVQQTSDGGYIITGETSSFGNGYQVYLIKTNASGDTLWTRNYGGTNTDGGRSIQQTSDGGYIIAGSTRSFGLGNADVWLIKTNPSGDTLWTRTYGGASQDEGKFVQQTSDGGYIVTGFTFSFGPAGPDVYLVKTNASGDTLWTKTYGGTPNEDYGLSVQQTQDGGYVIAGQTYSFGLGFGDVWLIKTNATGDTLWTRTYGGSGDEGGYSIQKTSDGGYIIAGQTDSFGGGGYNVFLIKTDAQGSSGVEESRQGGREIRGQGFTATPNPFTSFATVPSHEWDHFSLYDISGRKVGTYRGDRVGEGLAPGIYFLRPEQGDARPVRVVKVR